MSRVVLEVQVESELSGSAVKQDVIVREPSEAHFLKMLARAETAPVGWTHWQWLSLVALLDEYGAFDSSGKPHVQMPTPRLLRTLSLAEDAGGVEVLLEMMRPLFRAQYFFEQKDAVKGWVIVSSFDITEEVVRIGLSPPFLARFTSALEAAFPSVSA